MRENIIFPPVKVVEKPKRDKLGPTGLDLLKKRFEKSPDAQTLLAKLESGSLDNFDGNIVRFLQEVLSDKNRTSLLTKLNKIMPSFLLALGPKAAGVLGAIKGAEFGKQYAHEKTAEYVTGRGSEYLSALLLNEKNWLLDEAGWFANFEKAINQKLHSAILGINEVVREKATSVITEVAEKTGGFAGELAEIPSGIAGYLAGSALTGSVLGVFREIRRSSGFAKIAEIIGKSDRMISADEKTGTEDPRLELLVLQRKIIEDPKRLDHKLKNEEWLRLAVAVRAAKSDLLREKTIVPSIIASQEIKDALEKQRAIVEAIITGQGGLSEIDRETAAEILSQFDNQLAEDVDPLEKRFKNHNGIYRKLGRYSRAFVVSGFNATGIPLLWKMAKFTTRMAKKGLKIAFPIP